MALHNVIGSALYGRLSSTPGTALWGNRIYDRQAPAGAALPYVIFSHRAGGYVPLSPVEHIDVTVAVVCVAESAAQARAGAAYIGSALAGLAAPLGLSAAGWAGIDTAPGDTISTVENVQGRQFWRDGAAYRVRMDKTGG